MALDFYKMHGLGNDFVIFDARRRSLAFTQKQIAAIADRRTGIGCDQLILLEPCPKGDADLFMRIYNPDGSQTSACGNASRCVASLSMAESGRERAVLRTQAGLLPAMRVKDGLIAVDMGKALLEWQEIPLAAACDTLHIPLQAGPLRDAVGVNMGNPHAIFFTDNLDGVPLAELGPLLERNSIFPERANIGLVQKMSETVLRYRVWERGTGITRACGSGACAAAVAGVRRGLTARRVEVQLDGGSLTIEWRACDCHVLMTGPATLAFTGALDASVLI